MIASLYQSLSAVSVAVSSLVSIDDSKFMGAASRQAAEQYRRIPSRVDPYADAAPLERVTLAGDEVFHGRDVAAFTVDPDLDVAERQPDFVDVARQRDRDRNRVGLIDGFFHEADHVAVFHSEKAQIAGLLQRGVGAARHVEIADIGFDIARFV